MSHGSRSFLNESANDTTDAFWLKPALSHDSVGIVDAIRSGIIGEYRSVDGPFGLRDV